MNFLLFILIVFNLSLAREWVLSPKISHGTMASNIKNNYPSYSKKSFEYRVLQIALDYENILPNFNVKHEKIYLAPLPKILHDNFKQRKQIYSNINTLKREKGVAKEVETGFLEAIDGASDYDKELIRNENEHRKELYNKICEYFKKDKKHSDCAKVPTVYHNAIKYLKFYSLNEGNIPSNPVDNNLLISSVSSSTYKEVWKALLDVLKEEKITVEKQDDLKGIINCSFKCNDKDLKFTLRVCAIKNQKLSACDEIAKTAPSDVVNPPVSSGTIVWIEKKDSTLIVSDDKSEDFEIMLCDKTSDGSVKKYKFDILEEKLPAKLTKKGNN